MRCHTHSLSKLAEQVVSLDQEPIILSLPLLDESPNSYLELPPLQAIFTI